MIPVVAVVSRRMCSAWHKEEQLVGVLGQLGDWGVVKAMQMGLGDRLSALGMGEKVTALAATMPVQSQSDQPAPADTKRFEVVVDFQVTEDGKGFFGNTLTYHDLPYDGLVGVEAQMTGILNEMSNVGVLQAVYVSISTNPGLSSPGFCFLWSPLHQEYKS